MDAQEDDDVGGAGGSAASPEHGGPLSARLLSERPARIHGSNPCRHPRDLPYRLPLEECRMKNEE